MVKHNEQVAALLGRNTRLEGRLSFNGTVRVDGHFEGNIPADGTLIVGEDALVEARIEISTILVSGIVRGNISASERVEILQTGKVYGDVKTPTIVIHEGALFQGRMIMSGEKDASVHPFNDIQTENQPPDDVNGRDATQKPFRENRGPVEETFAQLPANADGSDRPPI